MRNRRNYYRILHVGPDAPRAVIQASYRALMQRLRMHPDLGGDPEQAVLVNEAYATLSDPQKRAEYDRTRTRPSNERRGMTPPTTVQERPGPCPVSRTPPGRIACSFCGTAVRAGDAERPDGECPACGGALYPAPRHRAGADSRRAVERVPRAMPVTFQLQATGQATWSGTTEDVSLLGMRLCSGVNLAVGARVKVDCAFCRAVAVVKSAARGRGPWPGNREYGLEFVTLHIKRERGGLLSTVA